MVVRPVLVDMVLKFTFSVYGLKVSFSLQGLKTFSKAFFNLHRFKLFSVYAI